MDIDLTRIKILAQNAGDVQEYIENALKEGGVEDPPYLSTCMVSYNQGGIFVMQHLAQRYEDDRDLPRVEDRLRFCLLVLCDEWGNKPIPGDKVIRKIQKPLEHSRGKPLTSEEINIDKMNGVYEDKWTRKIEHTVDEKGCIWVEFPTASHFLTVYGVHGKSGAAMSIHKKEHSGDPVKTPSGQLFHAWYWRFKEQDRAMYAKLPKIPTKREDPPRGLVKIKK